MDPPLREIEDRSQEIWETQEDGTPGWDPPTRTRITIPVLVEATEGESYVVTIKWELGEDSEAPSDNFAELERFKQGESLREKSGRSSDDWASSEGWGVGTRDRDS